MSLTEEEIQRARELLEQAARPLFLHDDDCDGVSCFVMCYQFKKDGKGVCVKQSPILKAEYLRKVEEYQPDLIVIMDKPQVEEEFFENTQLPVLWIDHHEPQTEQTNKYGNVTYLNPRIHDDADNRPTSYWVYKITATNLWVATMGCVGDWHIPDFIDEFNEQYPGMLPETYEKVEDLYVDTPIGKLIQVLQFNLKGTITDVRKSIVTLTKIQRPEEILEQTTPRGRFLWKKYRKHAAGYDRHLEYAKKEAEKEGPILLYEYDNEQTYTSELSNELLIRFPKKIILVARLHEGRYKCSVRSKETELPSKIQTALKGLDGRGGGHKNACGVVVAKEDWKTFYQRLEEEIKKEERSA